jgi:RNA recognition motif-containing protein
MAANIYSYQQTQKPEDPTKETILQTSRLFLRNLAFSCTDTDLLELCRPFGEVSQVSILVLFIIVPKLGFELVASPGWQR